MKPRNLLIKDLITSDEQLTFLVGGGVSIDLPSGMPSQRMMLDEIIRFSCPESEIEKILSIKNLRFEDIYSIYMKDLDKDSEIMDYFETCEKPNFQHFFLAEMIKKGNFVMTTNNDFLIEYALQQSGIPNEEIVPVITKYDFESYYNPYELFKHGKKTIYKLHGSTKNIITHESTRESLSGFQIEPFKQPLLWNISEDRSIVVMGKPITEHNLSILKSMKNIRNLIWIHYTFDDGGIEKVYEIDAETVQILDQMLFEIKERINAEHIFRVDVNTTRMVRDLLDTTPKLSPMHHWLSISEWLEDQIKKPNELTKYLISYKIYLDHSLYEDALRCAETTLKLSEEIGDKSNTAKILNNIGKIYYVYGDYHKALEKYEKALKINEELGNILMFATIHNNIGEIYRKRGNYSEALKRFEEALKIDDQLGDLIGKATSLNNLGKVYTLRGNYSQALNLYNEALKINEELGNLKGKANLLNNIGEIYRVQGNYPEALKRFEEALRIDEKRGNLLGKATEFNNIGLIYYVSENYDKALENFNKAISIAEQLGDLPGIATRFNNIGLIYHAKKNYSEAQKYYEKAFQIFDQLGDISSKAISMNNIGMIYQVQNNYTEALDWYKRALQVEEQIGSQSGKATSLNNIGMLYQSRGDYPEALKLYEEALQIAEQLGDLWGKATNLYNIGMIFQAQGNFPEALTKFKTAYEILTQLQLGESSLACAIEERIEISKWEEEKKIIKQILEYEFKNQEFITKRAMVKEFNIKITKTAYYLDFLNISIDYEPSEIPQLELFSEELIKNDEELTMYNLIVELGFDLLTTKKIAKFLLDYEIIEKFPRFSKKELKIVEKDKKVKVITQKSLKSADILENIDLSVPKQISRKSLERGVEIIEGNKVMGDFFETQKEDSTSQLLYVKGSKKVILVFMSYATVDSERFRVSRICEILTNYPEIENVLYWEEDVVDNFYEYMNDNLGKCHTLLLICSENALESKPVRMEWMTAHRLGKKIVPIFIEQTHIPPLLTTIRGVQFKEDNLDKTIEKIYKLILKKTQNFQ